MKIFSSAEYQQRLHDVQTAMEQAGLEVLLLADPANMNYLTGYDGWTFYTPQVVVVAQGEAQPYWIGRGMDANGAKHTCYLAPEHIIGYPDRLVQVADNHPMRFVGDFLKERGWHGRPIGVEKDAYYFSARWQEELERALPDARFRDCSLLVNWVRSVKSEAEIGYMRQAGKIAERVMQAALDHIAPGVRECDAVAEVYRAQVRGCEEFGGDYPAIVPMMPTGEKTSAPHLTWTDEPYRNEQAVNLELAGCRHRYHSPLARTAYIGRTPPQRLQDLAERVIEGLNVTLAAIRPGITCEDVERVWREHIARFGLEKESRIGYAVGVNYPPDWGEHTMSLRPGDKTILQPNMTFHMILGMWLDDYGYECSEALRVTQNGCETFADFPRELFRIG